MTKKLIEPTLLFEMELELPRWKGTEGLDAFRVDKKKGTLEPWPFSTSALLPHFAELGGFETHWSVHSWWSEAGLYFQLESFSKKERSQKLPAPGSTLEGLKVWIDTRCSPNVHRATRYCHCFQFYPDASLTPPPSFIEKLLLESNGSESVKARNSKAHGILYDIPRARQTPDPIHREDIQVRSSRLDQGCILQSFVPSKCLTGYSPLEFDRISLFYDVYGGGDSVQSMSLGPELRYMEDPSLWIACTLV